MFTVAERRAALLHTSPTDQMCGWLDRRLPSSYFISTLAVSSVAAMVGRLAPLKVSQRGKESEGTGFGRSERRLKMVEGGVIDVVGGFGSWRAGVGLVLWFFKREGVGQPL
ncbi:hypothetical protein H0E87_028330 [Populus deltoides]|uniref:Uncharacterized protein n=1 Tax=Populus deltoides TaxID=3696 RepID=A0A8T2WSR6_POPDE|nr:hypothetical protein H0E87_028330 [Populus deltoides]